jgi:RNA polymerase sigma-70 factor (ECF subfamily)
MSAQEIDLSLIHRAIGGDAEAFASLFDTYHQQVHNYALWLCGDGHSAEDIAQETFIRAHRNMAKLGPPYNMRAWLFRLAHNYYVDTLRQRGIEIPLDREEALFQKAASPEAEIAHGELSSPVSRALGRLATSEREALVLREVEGFQYHEIAEVMGISLDSVKVVLHRARGTFKDYYAARLLAEDPIPACEVLGDLLDSFVDGHILPAKQDKLVRDHIKTAMPASSASVRSRPLPCCLKARQSHRYHPIGETT